jgi:hypothetical protein
LRRGDGGQPFVFRLLAGLATLGLVLQSLVVEKDLLSGGPDEMFITVNAEN